MLLQIVSGKTPCFVPVFEAKQQVFNKDFTGKGCVSQDTGFGPLSKQVFSTVKGLDPALENLLES